MRGYYFITDHALSRKNIFSDIKAALRADVGVIQYRAEGLSSERMYREAKKIRLLCKKKIFIVNNRVDIALAVGADGVHLGQDDLPCKIARRLLGKERLIGVTVHTRDEARAAEDDGADYLGVAPIFATKTKHDAGKPCGVKLLVQIRKEVSLPLVAVGGINLSNARLVLQAGAQGLCAIGAVLQKKDIAGEIKKFQKLFSDELYQRHNSCGIARKR